MNKLSIILPTYNEIDNIEPLLASISVDIKNINHEIIVVDDNSPDGTAKKVEKIAENIPNIKLIVRKSDRGLIPSIKEGIKQAKGDVCLWMDADLSMSPKLLKEFIKEIEQGADLVFGSRYIKGGGMKGAAQDGKKTSLFKVLRNISSSEDSVFSALISKYGNIVLKMILHAPFHDYSSGFFCARKELFKTIELEGSFVDYCLSLPFKTYKKGFKVKEIPMILATRQHGQSKTSNSLSSIIKIALQCFSKAFILRLTVKDERGKK